MNEAKSEKTLIEEQITVEQRQVRYDIREYTIEYYVNKYLNGVDEGVNELYIPDYQREFVWDDRRQSRFIESLLLGLPVPLIFVSENEMDGRLEIVDGSQRLRTMSAYLTGELTLSGLQKLTRLNGKKYEDLPEARKRKFKNSSMRMIVLSALSSEDVKNEMFDRLNTSGVPLMPQEIRRGIYKGKFMDFITEVAESEDFKSLCPENEYMARRREEEEMALRFFAFFETYPKFALTTDGKKVTLKNDGVARFLDAYLLEKNRQFEDKEKEEKQKAWDDMLNWVSKKFPNRGFAKQDGAVGVSKPYFEAIAVGTALAQKTNPDADCTDVGWSIVDKKNASPMFKLLAGRYRTHTPDKLRGRIDYVKKQFK